MPRFSIVKKPSYAVTSVDNALQLMLMLRQLGVVGVHEAAEYLGVAPSTVHRLLSTLVYRGFASQDGSRRYVVGPVLRGESGRGRFGDLLAPAMPHMEVLSGETGETVSLVRRVGVGVEFLASVESREPLRVGERTGSVLPARLTSGGKALLAGLGEPAVRALYAGRTVVEGERLTTEQLDRLVTELKAVRETGVAYNVGRTEPDIAAVGMAVPFGRGAPWAAIAISAPAVRSQVLQARPTLQALRDCCAAMQPALEELADNPLNH